MSAYGRKSRSAGIAGLAALALIGAGCAGAPERPSYLRITVSQKRVVYLQFQGGELRAAMSIVALAGAKPVRSSVLNNEPPYAAEPPVQITVTGDEPRFEAALPVPAGELPGGLTAVRVSVLDGVLALTLCRTDDRNVEWRCRTRWLDYRTGLAAADAPIIEAPDAAKIALAVTGVPAPGKLGIGLNLVSGKYIMGLKRADGKGIAAQVRVADEAGREIVCKPGTLNDFGFKCDGPCYTLRVAKGTYALEGTLEAGPFGGTLKAERKVAVP